MIRICGILLLLMKLSAAASTAQTPPRPWEKYNAILNSDYVLLVQLVDTSVINLKGPYFSWNERRVVARLRVDSVLYVSSGQWEKRPLTVNVLLPSLVEYDEAPDDYGPQTISLPKFFVQRKQFVAALIPAKDKATLMASSNYPRYSFVVKDSVNIDLIKQAKRNSIDRNSALKIAREIVRPSGEPVELRMVGVQIIDHVIHELKYEKPNAMLMWRASNSSKVVYIDPTSGNTFPAKP